MAKQNKPAIRFKGFTDAWEQRKLGDNIVEYTEVTTENNQYPPLTSSRKGIFLQTEYFAGNQIASDDNTGYNIVPYGYFTYRHMSDDEVFHFNINDIVEKGIVSTLYPVFTTDENLDSRYLQYQLNYGHEFAKFAILQKQGGSRTYMYLNKLRQLHLTMPNHVEEQKAISSFFMNLDHLITLHQRKFDKLQVLKKAMLEKMFPKNGSSVPEIRFKGFTDAWEQRKLGEISEIKTGPFGSILHADDYVSEGVPIITTEHFKTGSLPQNASGLPQVSEVDYKRLSAYTLNNGDIVFSRVGSVDINALVTPFQRNWLFSGRVLRVRPEIDVLPQFLHTRLETESIKNDICARAVGQTMPSINTEILKATQLVLPTSMAEQKQIGLYFAKLDHLITLHQRELEKLQNIKKSMLEKMFV